MGTPEVHFLILMKSIFYFVTCSFGVISKKHCLKQGQEHLPLCFLFFLISFCYVFLYKFPYIKKEFYSFIFCKSFVFSIIVELQCSVGVPIVAQWK